MTFRMFKTVFAIFAFCTQLLPLYSYAGMVSKHPPNEFMDRYIAIKTERGDYIGWPDFNPGVFHKVLRKNKEGAKLQWDSYGKRWLLYSKTTGAKIGNEILSIYVFKPITTRKGNQVAYLERISVNGNDLSRERIEFTYLGMCETLQKMRALGGWSAHKE